MRLETKRPKKNSVYTCFLLLGIIVYTIESVTIARGIIPMLLTLSVFMWLASLYYGYFDKKFTEEERKAMPDTRAQNKDTLFCLQMIEPCETNDFGIYGKTGNDIAIQEIKKGNYSQAKTILEKYLNRTPDQSAAWVNLGLTYVYEKQYQRAKGCFTKAADKGQKIPQIPQGIALCEFLLGNYEACLKVCKEYDELYPDGKLLKLQDCCLINIKVALSNDPVSKNVPQESEPKSCNKTFVIEPEGYYFENALEFAVYAKCFARDKKVYWLRGEDYITQYKKGYQLFEQGQYSNAIEIYKKSLLLNPIGIRARFEICEAYLKMNNLVEARNTLLEMKDFLVEDKSIARFYRRMGYIETETKNYTLAITCYSYSLHFEIHPSVTQELIYITSQGGELVVPTEQEKTLSSAGIPILKSQHIKNAALKE